jgi:Zn-dependent M28 family amino/carboxypeptidase
LFLFTTAEERGLLGARWYAEHPLVPLETTLCDINLDSLNVWGRTADVESIGFGASTLDQVLIDAAAAQSRVVRPDSEPERGYSYRADHFEFVKHGVPALYADRGSLYIGQDPSFGTQKHADFIAHDYHKPSDEVRPDWDLAGAIQDLDLLVDVGRRIAQATDWPAWKPGSEFRERRLRMLATSR